MNIILNAIRTIVAVVEGLANRLDPNIIELSEEAPASCPAPVEDSSSPWAEFWSWGRFSLEVNAADIAALAPGTFFPDDKVRLRFLEDGDAFLEGRAWLFFLDGGGAPWLRFHGAPGWAPGESRKASHSAIAAKARIRDYLEEVVRAKTRAANEAEGFIL